MLSFPLFIWRISLATICCAFGPYLRVLPGRGRRARVVRDPVPVAFDERALVKDEGFVARVERRPETVLLRERVVEVRRVPAVAPVRCVRVVEAFALRGELARRRAVASPLERDDVERRRLLLVLPLTVRTAVPRAARELDLELLVAMV